VRRLRTGVKAALLGLAIALAAAAIVPSLLSGERYEFHITNEQITEALTARFPVRKVYLYAFDITYKNPRAVLVEGTDRVTCGLDASLLIKPLNPSEPLEGTADVTCGIGYDPNHATLYLTDPRVINFQIEGIPAGYSGAVQKVANRAAGEYLSRLSVYTLKPQSVKTSLARLVLKKATVKDGVLVVTLGI
jgi:hypothetical protein